MRNTLQITSCQILASPLVSPRIKPTLPCRKSLTQGHGFSRCPPVNTTIGYDWIDGVERLETYKPGGYHPVMIDDLMRTRYTIIDKLGFGGYSTVWLVRDKHTDSVVALKVGISRASPAQREYQIFQELSNPLVLTPSPVQAKTILQFSIPSVLDSFEVQGPNGTHRCYTMEMMQGDLRSASYSRLFPIRVARVLAAKFALAVDHVHSRGFVHGGVLEVQSVSIVSWLTNLPDIRLCNVLIKAAPTITNLSIDQFREQYGQPETVPVSRTDCKELPLGVPSQVVLPLGLVKKAQEFTLHDAAGLVLCDFGKAFAPVNEQRLGRVCNTQAVNKAPEAFLEPDRALAQSSNCLESWGRHMGDTRHESYLQ
jgi:serine/threonine-protein kinase SRPK3